MCFELQTDPEVSSSGQLPQPLDVFLGVNTGQVSSVSAALLLGGIPDQPLRDDQVAHRIASCPP